MFCLWRNEILENLLTDFRGGSFLSSGAMILAMILPMILAMIPVSSGDDFSDDFSDDFGK